MKRKAISILTAIFLLLATPSVGGVTVAGAESEAILTQTTQFGAEETSPPTEKAVGEGEVATPDTAPPSATEEAPPPAEGTAEPTAAEEETPPAAALIGEAVRQPVRLMSAAEDFTIQGSKLIAYVGTGGAVDIPDGIEIIGTGAFKNKTSVTSVTIPSSVQTIEDAAFMNAGLTGVVIPDSVVNLGYSVYKSGDTEYATTVENTTYTGVFTNCANLTSVTIGAGLSQIPPNTFKGCVKLAGVTIPGNITTVGTGAFLGCTNLTSVSLPSGLLTLGSGAFSKTGLVSVTIPGSVVSIRGCWSASDIASKDSHYSGYYYNRGVFMDCPNLVTVTVQNGVTVIGTNMFAYCPSLTSVSLPQSVTSIDFGAFYNSTGLSGIALPQNLASVSAGAFAKSSLTNITLPNSLQTLGTYNQTNDTTVSNSDLGVFTGCTLLVSANLGAGLASVASNTFKGCTSLNSVAMNDDITSIGKAAFYGCSILHNITLPYNLAIIGTSAFYQVTGIRAYENSPSVAAASAAGLSVTLIPSAQEKVAAPAANPPSGAVVTAGTSVALSSATAGATIRYTTNGSEPTASSPAYSAPIAISAAVTIKARAFKSGMGDSDVSVFSYTVAATPTPDAPALTVGAVTGKPGDVVDVPVTIANNPGIAGFTIKLNFDKTKLTPVSVTQGAVLNAGTLLSNVHLPNIDLVQTSWSTPSNVMGDGVLFTVRFAIKEDAQEGASPITAVADDVTNQSLEDVSLALTHGAVNVIAFIYGDIYGDGVVNSKDAVKLAQYLAGWPVTMSPAELSAADVHADGAVNSKDAVKLAQYLAGWPVTLGVS